MKYCGHFNQPVHFLVVDNGKSVFTNTRQAWTIDELSYDKVKDNIVTYFSYHTKFPNAGAGERVQFEFNHPVLCRTQTIYRLFGQRLTHSHPWSSCNSA